MEGRQVQIRLQPELYDRLKAEAKKLSINLSSLVTLLALTYLGEINFEVYEAREVENDTPEPDGQGG